MNGKVGAICRPARRRQIALPAFYEDLNSDIQISTLGTTNGPRNFPFRPAFPKGTFRFVIMMPKTTRIHRNMFWDHLTLPSIGVSIFELQISIRQLVLKISLFVQESLRRPFGFWILASGSWILDYEV